MVLCLALGWDAPLSSPGNNILCHLARIGFPRSLLNPGTLASLTKPYIHESQGPVCHPWTSPVNNATSGFMLHVPNLSCLNPHQNCRATPHKSRYSPFTLSHTYDCLVLLNLFFFPLAMVQNIDSVSKNVLSTQSFIYCIFKRFYLFIYF